MRKLSVFITLSIMIMAFATPSFSAPSATVSGSEFKAGDTVTIEGMIEPGQDLSGFNRHPFFDQDFHHFTGEL